MKVDVQFINFPKSDLIRNTLLNKISECVEKYTHDMATSVKAFFSIDGTEAHIKIAVIANKINLCVNGVANDVAHALDKALNKFEASLRKIAAKRKHKKAEFPRHIDADSDFSAANLRHLKRAYGVENIFDKYEVNYISDFEDKVRKAR